LPYLFENTLFDPFLLPNGTKINSLLYANDLIMLSRSKNRITKLFKHSLFILQDMDVKSQSQENKNDIPKTPKEIR